MSSAARTRRWRQRANDGRLVVPVEIDIDDTEALVDASLLDPRYTDDRRSIADAVRRLLRLLRGGDASRHGF